MELLEAHLGAVAGFQQFLTVAQTSDYVRQLHTASDGMTTLDVIGHSRGGHPMQMLSVGQGSRHALVVGMPHPNEPIGTLASLRLAELLVRDHELLDSLGLVWHFVPCADPDGARLNEAWFKGPFDRATYAANLHRPPFAEQFEWTFHRDDLTEPGLDGIPESRAVMSVIDTLRPELLVSMHNGESGGLYGYVTDKIPTMQPAFETIRRMTDVPLDLGEPEEPADRLSPGVYYVPPNVLGGPQLCSTDYAGKYDAFGITSEPPLWAVGEAENMASAGSSRGDVVTAVARQRRQLGALHAAWFATVAEEQDISSARGRAVRQDAEALSIDWFSDHEKHDTNDASIAYASSLARGLDLERLRGAGQIIGLLRAEQASGDLSARARATLDDAQRAVLQWASEASSAGGTFVGLKMSVRCHVGIALAGAAGISGRL